MKEYRIYYNNSNIYKDLLLLLPSSFKRSNTFLGGDFKMNNEEFTLFWLATCDIRAAEKLRVFKKSYQFIYGYNELGESVASYFKLIPIK